MKKLTSMLLGMLLGATTTALYAQAALEDQLEALENRLWTVINSTEPSSVKEFAELLKTIDETKLAIAKRDANPRKNSPSATTTVVAQKPEPVVVPVPVEPVITTTVVAQKPEPAVVAVVPIEQNDPVQITMAAPTESVIAVPSTEPAAVLASIGKRVIVDRATYTMSVYNNSEVVDTQRVIIGKPGRPTPAFSSVITHVVLNPYWNVSPNIATLDLAPLFLNNPKEAINRGYEVFNGWTDKSPQLDPLVIDWSQFGSGKKQVPYMIRQKPGPDNALGKIKFIVTSTDSSNQGIFLHGTHDHSLFDRDIREFSSGCVRVENDVHLAKILLNGDSSLSEADIQRQVDTGVTKWIKLRSPVEVTIQ